jgi:hypothetical protein
MTSNEIVDQIRQRINKIHPTESFQDAYLWREFTMARSRVLKNQLSRRNILSALNYHSVCLELIDVDESECSCILTGCKVKRTKYQLPSFLHTSSNSTLQVSNIRNTPIPQSQQDSIDDDMKYKPGYKNKQVATIRNAYLYIYNSSAMQVVVKGIWSNPLELLFIQFCKDAENGICLGDQKDFIQISEELLLDMFNIVISSLNPSLQIPPNNTNDNEEKV